MGANVDLNSPSLPLPAGPNQVGGQGQEAPATTRVSETVLPDILRTDSLTTSERPLDISARTAGTLDPSFPALSPANLPNTATNLAQQIAANPFFEPSVVSVLMDILNQVAKFEKNTRFMESQIELKSRQISIDLGKTGAELTKDAFAVQAESKRVEAINAFVSATIAGITAINTIGAAGKAQKDAQAQVEKEITAQEEQVNKLTKNTVKDTVNGKETILSPLNERQAKVQQIQDEIDGRGIVASTEEGATPIPLSGAPLKNKQAELTQAQAELDEVQGQVKAGRDKLNELKATADQRIVSLASQNQIEVQRHTETYMRILQDISTGTFKTIEAGLTQQEGAFRALHEINESLLAVLRTYLENSRKASNDARDGLRQIVESLNRAVDANYSHVFGRG